MDQPQGAKTRKEQWVLWLTFWLACIAAGALVAMFVVYS